MTKTALLTKKYDKFFKNKNIHIIQDMKFSGQSSFFRSYSHHLLVDVPYSRTTYINLEKLKIEQLKIAPILRQYVQTKRKSICTQSLFLNNINLLIPAVNPMLLNGRIVSDTQSKKNIYDLNNFLLDIYSNLDFNMFIITTEKLTFSNEFYRKMNNRIDFTYFDTLLPSDYGISIDEFINQTKNEIPNSRLSNFKKYILSKYKNTKRIELFPKLIRYIALNTDKKLSIQSLTEALQKYDKDVIKYNVKALMKILDDNFIVNKCKYYDINNKIIHETYFKYYFSNLSKLFLFLGNKEISKYEIYKSLIFEKLLINNLDFYIGKYYRYTKINGVTVKIPHEVDFIFTYENKQYALNLESEYTNKYNDLSKLIGYNSIYIKISDDEIKKDKNGILNISLNKFLAK